MSRPVESTVWFDDADTARIALISALDCPKGDLAACPTFWSIVDARLDRALADNAR